MPLAILHIPDTCTGCGACASVCPKQALAMQYDKEGFYFPILDENKCISCKQCEKVCHVLNNKQPEKPSTHYDAYMMKAKDSDIICHSSSGGAFSILADTVLRQGGVVYGARYNFGEERLEHSSTEQCSIVELRKSKYIESYTGEIFKDVMEQLSKDRKVLFCGAPCQVEGLHNYLTRKKVNLDNIFLVRFVCHGVPSNKFFTDYKHYEEKKHGAKMTSFDFRPKTRGWRSSDWRMTFANGKEDNGPYYYYYYYYYFQLSDTLRKSCYSCRRVFHECADITMADFWGISKYRPENSDQEGISLLLAHSEKAKVLIPKLSDECTMEQLPHTAFDYIYREVNDRSEGYARRNEIMQKVCEKGYMPVAKQTLGTKIFINKAKGKFAKYYMPILLWIRKK